MDQRLPNELLSDVGDLLSAHAELQAAEEERMESLSRLLFETPRSARKKMQRKESVDMSTQYTAVETPKKRLVNTSHLDANYSVEDLSPSHQPSAPVTSASGARSNQPTDFSLYDSSQSFEISSRMSPPRASRKSTVGGTPELNKILREMETASTNLYKSRYGTPPPPLLKTQARSRSPTREDQYKNSSHLVDVIDCEYDGVNSLKPRLVETHGTEPTSAEEEMLNLSSKAQELKDALTSSEEDARIFKVLGAASVPSTHGKGPEQEYVDEVSRRLLKYEDENRRLLNMVKSFAEREDERERALERTTVSLSDASGDGYFNKSQLLQVELESTRKARKLFEERADRTRLYTMRLCDQKLRLGRRFRAFQRWALMCAKNCTVRSHYDRIVRNGMRLRMRHGLLRIWRERTLAGRIGRRACSVGLARRKRILLLLGLKAWRHWVTRKKFGTLDVLRSEAASHMSRAREELEEELIAANADRARLREENNDGAILRRRIDELQLVHRTDLEQMEAKLLQAECDTVMAQTRVGQLEEDVHELEKEREGMQRELELYMQQVSAEKVEAERARTERDAISHALLDGKKEISGLKSMVAENKTLQTELRMLRGETDGAFGMKHRNDLISELRDERDKLMRERADMMVEVEELRGKVEGQRAFTTRMNEIIAENKMLAGLVRAGEVKMMEVMASSSDSSRKDVEIASMRKELADERARRRREVDDLARRNLGLAPSLGRQVDAILWDHRIYLPTKVLEALEFAGVRAPEQKPSETWLS